MKTQYFSFLFLIFCMSQNLLAQPSDKTIQVVGNARVVVQPDIGVLNISVSEIRESMSEAMNELGETTNKYTELLTELDFSKEDIKTTNFSVSKNRIYRRSKYIDSGYVASQKVRLEFEYNQKILSAILGKFSDSKVDINFNFDFKLSEELKAKVQEQVIQDAVKNGAKKAETLAKASKQTIIELNSIVYGQSGNNRTMQRLAGELPLYEGFNGGANSSRKSLNYNPDDIVYSDSVMMYFRIK